MVSEIQDPFLHFPEGSTEAMMEQTLQVIYPFLFLKVNALCLSLNSDPSTDENFRVRRLLDKLQAELDSMYRQEKYLLFPFIEKLLRENKLSDSCAPFNIVKGHYKTALRLCAEIKAIPENMPLSEPYEENPDSEFIDSISGFIDLLIQSHQLKETYLYRPLKSCLGCKK